MELKLDAVEAFIAGLCDGRHTVGQMEALTAQRFGIRREESDRHITDTLARLARFLAISADNLDLLTRHVAPPAHNPWTCGDITRLSAPKTVFWEVTYACNLRCRHCVTASGARREDEFDTEQALSLIGQLAEAKVFELILTGGEPFLRPDIFEILGRLSEEKICVKIDTNATAISKKALDALPELGVFALQVSLDGIGETHDAFRGKKNAFNAACRNIARLIDRGMRVNILTTVIPANIDELDAIIDLARDMGCGEIVVSPYIDAGRGRQHYGLRLSVRDHYRMYATVLKKSKELEGRLKVVTEPNPLAFSMENNNKVEDDGPMGCAVGHTALTIGANGTVYPCPFLHDLRLGNIAESPLTKIWANSPVLESVRGMRKKDMGGKCRSCRFAPGQCAGGCRARALFEFEDIKAMDPACILPLLED